MNWNLWAQVALLVAWYISPLISMVPWWVILLPSAFTAVIFVLAAVGLSQKA